jgi:hypothetical protein
MAKETTVSCSNLTDRNDFQSYIEIISEATGGNFSLVAECKAEICGALWGSGNPDISGVGMSVGFVLQSVLGSIFAYIFLLCRTTESNGFRRSNYLLASTFRIFHDSAVFLTFSVQVASIVVLTKANFGVSADGMGANSVKITWVVSLLTLLPLSYGTFVFQSSHENVLLKHARQTKSVLRLPQPHIPSKSAGSDGQAGNHMDGDTEEASTKLEARDQVRFLLFVICWMLSVYPFLSRMVGTFGKPSPRSAFDSMH